MRTISNEIRFSYIEQTIPQVSAFTRKKCTFPDAKEVRSGQSMVSSTTTLSGTQISSFYLFHHSQHIVSILKFTSQLQSHCCSCVHSSIIQEVGKEMRQGQRESLSAVSALFKGYLESYPLASVSCHWPSLYIGKAGKWSFQLVYPLPNIGF